MNRQQRRAHNRAQEKKRAFTAGLMKNGLGTADLKKAFEDGFRAGWSDATPGVVKTCYAGTALALKQVLNLDRDQIKPILSRLDEIVRDTLTSREAIEQVWQDIGLRLDFDEPLDSRVKEKDQ